MKSINEYLFSNKSDSDKMANKFIEGNASSAKKILSITKEHRDVIIKYGENRKNFDKLDVAIQKALETQHRTPEYSYDDALCYPCWLDPAKCHDTLYLKRLANDLEEDNKCNPDEPARLWLAWHHVYDQKTWDRAQALAVDIIKKQIVMGTPVNVVLMVAVPFADYITNMDLINLCEIL